ncbi:hypothetical protein FRC12_024700 [Ceratobasidium sp. 428]|nr:hypothetical protein FRC12_024700 [Ceratobasidium sp. 428]
MPPRVADAPRGPKCNVCTARGPNTRCNRIPPVCNWCRNNNAVCTWPAQEEDNGGDQGQGGQAQQQGEEENPPPPPPIPPAHPPAQQPQLPPQQAQPIPGLILNEHNLAALLADDRIRQAFRAAEAQDHPPPRAQTPVEDRERSPEPRGRDREHIHGRDRDHDRRSRSPSPRRRSRDRDDRRRSPRRRRHSGRKSKSGKRRKHRSRSRSPRRRRNSSPSPSSSGSSSSSRSSSRDSRGRRKSSRRDSSRDSERRSRPKKVLHRPSRAEGVLLEGASFPIPPAILKIMENGWKAHFSLCLLDPAFLEQPDAAHRAQLYVDLMSGRKVADKATETRIAALGIPREENMTHDQWRFAWDILLPIIEDYMPTDCFEAWQKHWHLVWTHSDVRPNWHRLMLYDIKMRQTASRTNFDMGTWQYKVYEEIVNKDRDDIAKGRGRHTTSHSTAAPIASSSHTRKASSDIAPPAKRTKHIREMDSDERCFRCGLKGEHKTKYCAASKQTNGRSPIIRRNGKNWTLDGSPFCYSFNTLKGCSASTCSNPPHICSLCRSTDHGAQACPV